MLFRSEEKGTKIKIKIKTAIKIRKNSSPPTKPISSTLILRARVGTAVINGRTITNAQAKIKNAFIAANLAILIKCAQPFMFLKIQITKIPKEIARNLEVENLAAVLGDENKVITLTSNLTINNSRLQTPFQPM